MKESNNNNGPPEGEKQKYKYVFLKHGLGRFLDQSGEYIGQFKDNLKNGNMGKLFCKNGDFYAGGWKNDMMDTSLQTMLNGVTRDAIMIRN